MRMIALIAVMALAGVLTASANMSGIADGAQGSDNVLTLSSATPSILVARWPTAPTQDHTESAQGGK